MTVTTATLSMAAVVQQLPGVSGTAAVPRPTHPWVAAGASRVRVGVYTVPTDDWGRTVALVQQAEALGFDSFWMSDHPTAAGHGYDCWTQLAGLAQATERIRLGTLVTCVFYRHPVLLARIVAEVDRQSSGRAVLGVGIGDIASEFAQLGLDLPPVPARQRGLAEALGIVARLWAGEEVTHRGEHFRTEGAVLRKPPVQEGGVPVLIAGGGERVTLRQVAELADASNFGPGAVTGGAFTVEDVRRKYAALDGFLAAAGRPHGAVLRTYFALAGNVGEGMAPGLRRVTTPAGFEYLVVDGSPHEIAAHYRGLIEAGVRYLIFSARDEARLRLLAEQVVPSLTD